MDYENYKYGSTRISADLDTVETAIIDGLVTPKAPSISDLQGAVEWLALYASGNKTEDDLEIAQSFANVVAFLELTIASRKNRKVLAEAKKQYAKQHNIKVSQVRINREAK